MLRNLVYVITVFLLASTLVACSKPVEGGGSSTAVVISAQTTMIQLQAVPAFVEVAGTLEGQQVVPIATKLMSEITFMGFEEGQRVTRGDILARIDDSEIVAMRNEAAAFGAEALGALAEVEAAIVQGEAAKAQAEAGLSQAVAANKDAQTDAMRFRKLVGESVVAPMQAEKYELAAEVATENVALAQAAVDAAQAGIDQAEARVPQVNAKKDQAAAKAAQAKALQDYATLIAPFDGVVTARLADPGQLSIPGQPLYQLADDSAFRVILAVAEDIVAGLSLGETVIVVVDAGGGGGDAIEGKILFIGGAADPATHTIRVEVGLDTHPGLLSGRFARVQIPSGEREVVLVVATAIVRDGDLTSVWRVSDSGLANIVPVDLGPNRNGMLEVFRGLSAGDRIVSFPPPEMFAGARVQSGNSAAGE